MTVIGSTTAQGPPAEKDILKADLKAKLAERKAHDGTKRGTRSQKTKSNQEKDGTVPRLNTTTRHKSSNCVLTVSDGTSLIKSTGRCDDGSDNSILSPKITEAVAIKSIGKISAIQKIFLAGPLKKGTTDSAECFSLSRTWNVPRNILHLASGILALMNISFLVADDDLACKDLPIGRPVFQNLQSGHKHPTRKQSVRTK